MRHIVEAFIYLSVGGATAYLVTSNYYEKKLEKCAGLTFKKKKDILNAVV